ncbi:MAG: SRPBCC family protein [Candidatus Melainabacteria bacterium]|nr:SRPBCC family protein [Candidatus Melainabacteria bacterium]
MGSLIIFNNNGSTSKTAGLLPAALVFAVCTAGAFGSALEAKTIESNEPRKLASEIPASASLVPTPDVLPRPSKNCVTSVMETSIKAPPDFVWQELTDFPRYPQLFPRIESCKVTKRSGNYVYTESNLKPQMFLRESKQRIVNDLNGKPHVLRWAMLEGNFESSQGRWELTPDNNGKSCKVKYTLESTTDPIPKAMASFTLKFIQKDIVKTFKRSTEKMYQTSQAKGGGNLAVSAP